VWTLGAELVQSARSLRRQPAVSLVVVATLALGIGASTAIFSFVYGILLRPFPYPDPNRLISISSISTRDGGREGKSSILDAQDWARLASSLKAAGAYVEFDADIRGDGPARPARMCHLNAGALAALGVSPELGRLFRAEEDQPGGDVFQALISHDLWQNRFSGRGDVLGQALRTSRGTFSVLGVMPPGFAFPSRADLWVPMESWYALQTGDMRTKSRHWRLYPVIARLKPGVSLLSAQIELDRAAAQLETLYPSDNAGIRTRVRPLREAETGPIAPYLRMMIAAAGAALLICCFNVAAILLSKAVSGARDFAVRSALGASRARQIRVSVMDTFLLSLAGGIAGVGLAWGLVAMLLRLLPDELPRWIRIRVDLPVLGFALLAALLATLLCGLAAAVFATRTNLGQALKESSRTTTGGGARLRSGFVVAQICLSLLLVIAAGLLTRSFLHLRSQETGFRPENLLVAHASYYHGGLREERAVALARFHGAVVEKLRALPGVEAVGASNALPYTRSEPERSAVTLRVRGESGAEKRLQVPTAGSDVSQDYFKAMGIRLAGGRGFDERDTVGSPMVVVVNRRAAERLWPGRDAVGQELYWGIDDPSSENPYCRVVGVVENVRHLAGERDDGFELYYPYTQWPIHNVYYVLRTRGEPLALAASARRAIASVDEDAAVVFVDSMDSLMRKSLWQQRLWSVLLTGFGVLSLALAAVGLYGLLSHIVSRRRREIGVRVALGAQPRNILALILRQGAVLVGSGVGLGLVAGLAVSRLLGSLVFGVKPTDQWNFLTACLMLVAVALVACWVPARRASGLDPVRALRDE